MKPYQALSKLITGLLFVVLLASCTASKSIFEVRGKIYAQQQLLCELAIQADSINEKRQAKAAGGELDDITDSIAKVYIARLKDTINQRLDYFDALLSYKKIRRNKPQIIAYLNDIKKSYSKELGNIYFLDDLFAATTFNRLNTATFFGPGEYALSDAATAQAKFIVQNIIKEAIDFSAAHADRKLKAMFIVLGYADEQPISNGSALYTELASSITGHQPDSRQLNTELSNRRATAIKALTKSQYGLMMAANTAASLTASFIATGKGEILPAGKITDYHPIDDRRRVVLIYWSILPELQ